MFLNIILLDITIILIHQNPYLKMNIQFYEDIMLLLLFYEEIKFYIFYRQQCPIILLYNQKNQKSIKVHLIKILLIKYYFNVLPFQKFMFLFLYPIILLFNLYHLMLLNSMMDVLIMYIHHLYDHDIFLFTYLL